MKEISVDEIRILPARVGDNFHAVSATCPHYGARPASTIRARGTSNVTLLPTYCVPPSVLAVAGMNRDREMAAAKELLRLDHMPTREQLQLNDANLVEMLQAPESINA